MVLVAGTMACSGGDEPAGNFVTIYEPGQYIDLGRRPLSRIADPTIVQSGGDPVLEATAFWYEAELRCAGVCQWVVIEVEEPLCVSLREPFVETTCTGTTQITHGDVDVIPEELETFLGHAVTVQLPSGGMRVNDVEYFGVHIQAVVEEGVVPGTDGGWFTREYAGVQRDGLTTFDHAPDSVPLGGRLVGWDVDGAAGAGLILRDGVQIELDQSAESLAGSSVGLAYFDPNGGRNVAFAPVGDEVISVRASATIEYDLDFWPPADPVRLYVEVTDVNAGAATALSPFRAVRASAPQMGAVTVCFNRRLDPASLGQLVLDASPSAVTGPAMLLDGDQCVSAPTEAQPLRAPITITASGATAIGGEQLMLATVTAQTDGHLARAILDAPIWDTAAPNLVPLSDGGVMIGEAGSEELAPDLFATRQSGLADLTPVATALPATGTGLWIGTDAGLVRYDAGSTTTFEDVLAVAFGTFFPLPNDEIVVGTNWLHADDEVTALVAPAELTGPYLDTPILGTSHFLWAESGGNLHVRADADGNTIDSWTGPLIYAEFAFETDGRLYIAENYGVGEYSDGEFLSWTDGTFLGWTALDDGFEVLLDTGAMRLVDGELVQVRIADPTDETRFMGLARYSGDMVFLRSVRPNGSTGLRVTHRDHWDAMVADALAEVP